MIQIISLSQPITWDEIVKSFPNYDVYYLSGYVKSFYIHGDGEPQLLYYTSSTLRAIYVYMKRCINNIFYDIITPYGYGGVLFNGEISFENLESFNKDFCSCMIKNNIVDNFVRYHPVLKNARDMREISTVIDLGKTVALNLSSEDMIWQNITSKNRNMIRKSEKNGVEIFHAKSNSLFGDFIQIYNETMTKDGADKYYYFENDFFHSIHKDLFDNYEMFYAVYDNKIIAMSIILFANNQMHYHLSGSLSEFRNLAPSNLLLYKVAIWGCQQGFKTFHLGGGIGSNEDNLYKFKAAFNRASDYQFSIGKQIFNQNIYNALVEERAMLDINFDRESTFFPLYRS